MSVRTAADVTPWKRSWEEKLEKSFINIYGKQDLWQLKTENPAKLLTSSSCSVVQLFNLL